MTLRILVVDDEPDLEALVVQRFRKRIRAGAWEFFFARNGVEALRVLGEVPNIEIVLTDLRMPEMDGLTLLSHLEKLDSTVKSVVISAYGDMENIRTAMNRGAFDFLTKPIDFEDLEITLNKTIEELDRAKEAARTRDSLAKLEQELTVANRIQQAMLPRGLPMFPGRAEFELAARMLPAREVAGDFYDFFPLDGRRLGFAIGDVSGKGVPAALFMSLARILIKSTALEGHPPAPCLERVNRLLYRENQSHQFVTAFYGVLHTATGRVDYACAGHHPPFLVAPDARPRRITQAGGMVLGIMESALYDSASVSLRPGDCLFVYTDGVTEAFDASRMMYGEARLIEALSRPRESASALIAAVVRDVEAFAAGACQSDDITALALRYLG